ncbi:hypothetical protein GCM10010174_58890 [Kutzneria viridogrisea]|uniref:Integral membrane protein n=2 Tax=Kutzneria TaxID=43356 RepID=W5W3L9_9PSEU|nr:hypothetical protein [Kutzneria albida]AHH95375.1 hypothetical protein KALB_2005 [Kutzneria albida DSM 43870]MBA8927268.1 energy-coupling factor transport system substrate-specific component [Kutzneria viridogrisea]
MRPSVKIAAGTLVVLATYVYLVLERPGVSGIGALVALAGYLLGSVLIILGATDRLSTSAVALVPVAIAINIVVGQLALATGIPLYLDSIGIVLVGVLAGPAAGAATGALTCVIWGLTINPTIMPFAVTAAEIGTLAGLAAMVGAFRRPWWAALSGLLTGIVSALVSSPISAFVYGGATTSAGTTAVVGVFQAYGNTLLASTTLQGLISDPLDKTVTFSLTFLILLALPARFRQRFAFARSHRVFARRVALEA